MVCAGFSLQEIGRKINGNRAASGQELKRNGPVYEDTAYGEDWTHPDVRWRRHKAQLYLRRSPQDLVNHMECKLKKDGSPEVMAEILRLNIQIINWACKEKIYQEDTKKVRIAVTWDEEIGEGEEHLHQ